MIFVLAGLVLSACENPMSLGKTADNRPQLFIVPAIDDGLLPLHDTTRFGSGYCTGAGASYTCYSLTSGVEWRSSAPDILALDAKGGARAQKEGVAWLHVSREGMRPDSQRIEVVRAAYISIEQISMVREPPFLSGDGPTFWIKARDSQGRNLSIHSGAMIQWIAEEDGVERELPSSFAASLGVLRPGMQTLRGRWGGGEGVLQVVVGEPVVRAQLRGVPGDTLRLKVGESRSVFVDAWDSFGRPSPADAIHLNLGWSMAENTRPVEVAWQFKTPEVRIRAVDAGWADVRLQLTQSEITLRFHVRVEPAN